MVSLPYVICSVLSFVPAIVFHEVAHGFAAAKLGDPTARRHGRLSLNPLKHIDPFGTVVMPFLLLALGGPVFGYAKPVPYNPAYFKNRRTGEAVVGLAGPAANLIMALLAGVVAWLLWPHAPELAAESQMFVYFYLMFLPMFALVNLYLMFFNLIPLPPLDGSSVIALFLSDRALARYYRVQRYAMPVFIAVVIFLPYFLHINPVGMYLDATAGSVVRLLFPFAL